MAAQEPFDTFQAIGVPIDIANCDTDQLIPARFLRISADDPDYPNFLLSDLRFNDDGSPKDFIYNQEPFRMGRIFVTDINWGCGSSREMAVIALQKNGIRVVIAPSFGDIHYANCVKNGLLPVRLPARVCDRLREQLHAQPGAEISVDLPAQTVLGPDQTCHRFEIDPFDKERLLKGLDEIGLTMQFETRIADFVRRYSERHPWAAR